MRTAKFLITRSGGYFQNDFDFKKNTRRFDESCERKLFQEQQLSGPGSLSSVGDSSSLALEYLQNIEGE